MGLGRFLFIVLPCFWSIFPSLSRWRPSSPGCFMFSLQLIQTWELQDDSISTSKCSGSEAAAGGTKRFLDCQPDKATYPFKRTDEVSVLHNRPLERTRSRLEQLLAIDACLRILVWRNVLTLSSSFTVERPYRSRLSLPVQHSGRHTTG
jgi:hypothetical protein